MTVPDTNTSILRIDLFAPGMSRMHRAGLGGLAATLERLELWQREHNKDLPGIAWDDTPPWEINERYVTIDFGEEVNAGKFLESLFGFAFQVVDKLMFLPGQYGDTPPSLAVRAALQQGIVLSFLQHGRVRSLAKKATDYLCKPEGDNGPTVQISFKECANYKRQKEWKDLVDNKGRLRNRSIDVVGPLYPGAVVRHNAFSPQTKIEQQPAHALCLYFAMVGCLPLSINRGCGVLVVPDVTDLLSFVEYRQLLTPSNSRQCRIAGPGDAALQAQLRLRSQAIANELEVPACTTIVFKRRPWASHQKSRVETFSVDALEEFGLRQFEIALAELPPRIASRTIKQSKGRGKKKKTTERKESFWVDSTIRPLIADNLAKKRPWYSGFRDLMTQVDPVSKKPLHTKIRYERKGLNSMIQKIPWNENGELTVIRCVHEAIRRRYGRIASENPGNKVAMGNRMSNEYERWRLAFTGAKTADQFRRAICDLLSRASGNPVLQKDWESLLPLLDSSRWQQARDLALLGLASYSGKNADAAADESSGDAA